MANLLPSIFNDVLGPVMRGPSSSHCAAAQRIGSICLDIMNGEITEVEVTYDRKGSLATTHKSQGSDMGLYAGLLGWKADDSRMAQSESALLDKGIKLSVEIKDTNASHPNTYELILRNNSIDKSIKAISVGGGIIEIIEIDQIPISIKGDYYELLIFPKQRGSEETLVARINDILQADRILVNDACIQIRSSNEFDKALISKMMDLPGMSLFSYLHPVLPVISTKEMSVPFISCTEMLAYSERNGNLKLWQLALTYEGARGNLADTDVFRKIKELNGIMKGSIQNGLAGTAYEDRILGAQSLNFKKQMDASNLLDAGMLNRIILYTSAVMESKSSMGLIVAAPTAGSSGTIPGTLVAAAEHMGAREDDLMKAMLAAGLIGVFIAQNATFSAEIAGCQAECGAASAMSAAGLVSLANGTLEQSIGAASLALQNSLGMICDPIANRVEAPCLGKNIMAASNALSCANMALADYNPLINFDEVVEVMLKVGKSMPHELRCTALGGLSITDSAIRIENQLKDKKK